MSQAPLVIVGKAQSRISIWPWLPVHACLQFLPGLFEGRQRSLPFTAGSGKSPMHLLRKTVQRYTI